MLQDIKEKDYQISSKKPMNTFRFPTWIMEVFNWLNFKRIVYKNPSLKFFHYEKRFHKIPEYCRKVLDKIESEG